VTTAIATPETAAQWEEYLLGLDSPDKIGAALADKGDTGFGAMLKGYIGAQNKERADIMDQVKEFTQSTIIDMFRANGVGDKQSVNLANKLNLAPGNTTAASMRKAALSNESAPGAKLDGQFGNIGDFIQTVWHNRLNGKQRIPGAKDADFGKKLELINAYSTQVPDAGGYLVPEEYRSQILMLQLEQSIVMPRATIIPMSTQSLIFPTVDATSNVSSVFGGIVVYRTQEGAEFVESQAKFGRVKLEATKQTALAYLHNETIRDSGGAVSAALGQMLPPAFAYNADIDFLTGLGAGEPLGALAAGNPALIAVTKETGQPNTTIVWQNVLRMYSRMLPTSIPNAVWLASPDCFFELATMALAVGTGGSAVWITDGTGSPVLTLLGRPVIMTEKTPGVLGAQGDLNFVDFTYYLVGIRDSLMVDTSDHVKFTSDQTTVRAIARNDGRPWLASPITPHNNGPTLSPFLSLGAR
jgi:HK97 family phage major capsid protein